MIKKTITTIIILLVIALGLCGCIPQPYAEREISSSSNDGKQDKPTVPTRTLYVSGAVQTDGYVTVPQICDYQQLLDIVGVTDNSVLPGNLSTIILSNVDTVILDFYCEDEAFSSVNVNGYFVTTRLLVDGVEETVINKLADYIEANGKITNRTKLLIALGDDYADNYYKFYIEISDYAQDN